MARLAPTPNAITDPVCGMKVELGMTRLVSNCQGHSYWFCSEDCRRAFEKNPEEVSES
jgi:YHS domain-containing protein